MESPAVATAVLVAVICDICDIWLEDWELRALETAPTADVAEAEPASC